MSYKNLHTLINEPKGTGRSTKTKSRTTTKIPVGADYILVEFTDFSQLYFYSKGNLEWQHRSSSRQPRDIGKYFYYLSFSLSGFEILHI